MKSKKIKNLIGRILISAIFVYSIPGKIVNFGQTVEVIISKNIPPYLAPFLLLSAIILLVFGTILFITGFKQRIGASLLLIFIVPTTFIFHFFPLQIKAILMNFGLIGGLILSTNIVKPYTLKDQFNNQKIKNNKNGI